MLTSYHYKNFDLVETKGKGFDRMMVAEVDQVQTFLWKTKVRRIKIAKEAAGYWFFLDNGKFVPGFIAEELYRKYQAEQL